MTFNIGFGKKPKRKFKARGFGKGNNRSLVRKENARQKRGIRQQFKEMK